MRKRWGLVGKASMVALLTAVLAPSIGAQWPSYPTAGVPRTADGKPNLEAPAPRTADGKVDFSGIWNRAGPGVAVADGDAAGRLRRPRRPRAFHCLSSGRSPEGATSSRSRRGRRI